MNRRHRLFVSEYLLATRNEIAIDESLYKLCNLTPDRLGHAPRPSKLVAWSRYESVLRVVVNLSRFFWRLGGARLFFLIEWLRLRKFASQSVDAGVLTASTFGVAFSSRAVDLATAQMKGECFVWGTLPWVPVELKDEHAVPLFGLLSGQDLADAFVLACIASRKLNGSSRAGLWGLQSYTAFRWFCVRLALDMLPAENLLIGEHYDRWAVLADAVMTSKRRGRGKSDSVAGLILIQHGVLAKLGEPQVDQSPELPIQLAARLRSVIRLYAFDQLSSDIFRRSVLSSLSPLVVENIHIYQPCLILSHLPGVKPVSVLFVGHPLCESLHLHFFQAIMQRFDASCYYKPHPANPSTECVAAGGWTLIADKRVFPAVSLLVSYPSTLVQEYEGMGIPAILHPLNMPVSAANEVTDSILRALNNLNRESTALQAN